MEKVLVVNEHLKRKMAIICFLPAVVFLIPIVYYTTLLLPLTQGYHVAKSIVAITSQHYNTMFLLLAIASSVSAAVLLYCIVYIVRIKEMTTGRKMEWVLLLLAVPVSFIFFWLLEIRKESGNMPIYTDIG